MKKYLSLIIIFCSLYLTLLVVLIMGPYSSRAQASEHRRLVPFDYPTIQAAINSSTDGDAIIVNHGIYYENINFQGKAITVQSTDPNDSKVIALTIIDGNQQNTAATFDSGEEQNSQLKGFTIQNSSIAYGAIYCSSSSPSIIKCLIKENLGTGICCSDSSSIISNCFIQNNLGGGLFCWESTISIQQCTINNNRSKGIYCGEKSSITISNCLIKQNFGNGIGCVDSTATIAGCTISGNNFSGGANGGGIYCINASPIIINCLIIGNLAKKSNGGGIYCDFSSSPAISQCNIIKNLAISGGGIYCDVNASPTIPNCIIARNSAFQYGGGICSTGAGLISSEVTSLAIPRPTIINCTITSNAASENGGGMYSTFSFLKVSNCILWNDSPDEVYGRFYRITYSNVQGDYLGKGNINGDPLFVDSEAGDYHLQAESPCIGKGERGCDMGAFGKYEEGPK